MWELAILANSCPVFLLCVDNRWFSPSAVYSLIHSGHIFQTSERKFCIWEVLLNDKKIKNKSAKHKTNMALIPQRPLLLALYSMSYVSWNKSTEIDGELYNKGSISNMYISYFKEGSLLNPDGALKMSQLCINIFQQRCDMHHVPT